jgi:hypothetical protein
LTRATLLGVALLLSGCATGPKPSDVAAACDVKVSFGSYAMGVDRALAADLQTAVDSDPRVARATRRSWGREGEFDLCLTIRPAASVRQVFAALGAKLQGHGEQAPTSIALANGETIHTATRR